MSEQSGGMTISVLSSGEVRAHEGVIEFFESSLCTDKFMSQLTDSSCPVILRHEKGKLCAAFSHTEGTDQVWTCELLKPWYETSREEMAVITDDGCILDMNRAWEEQFPECCRQSLEELLSEDISLDDVLTEHCTTQPLSHRRYRELLTIPLDLPGLWYTLLLPAIRPESIRLDLFHHQLFERSLFPIAILDTEEVIQDVNPEFEQLFGYTRREVIGKYINDYIIPPDKQEKSLRFIQAIHDKNTLMTKTFRMARGGAPIEVEAVGSPIIQEGQVIGMFAMYKDISQEQRHLLELRKQKAFFQQLFDNSPDAIALVDDEDRVVMLNHSFTELFGYTLEETAGNYINNYIVTPEYMEEASACSRYIIEQEKHLHVESKRLTRSRGMIDMEILAFPIYVQKDRLGAYALYRDISDRTQKEAEIRRLIYTDPLTGLFNRFYCYEQLIGYITKGIDFLLLYCDLDRFKEINDMYGHHTGDELLQAIGSRLKTQLSGFDIARVGGDEFALFTDDPSVDSDQAIQSLRDVFTKPFHLSHGESFIGLSIGTARYPEDGTDVDELIKCADLAMYREKRLHRTLSSKTEG